MTKNNSSLSKVKFEVDKLNYSDLQANKNVSDKINFPNGKFIINNQPMNLQFINDVYNNEEKKLKFIEEAKQNANNDHYNGEKKLELIKKWFEDNDQLNIEIFKKKLLEPMKLPIPSDYIIQELITCCYLYESFITTNVLLNSNLLNEIGYDHNKKVYINFINPNCVQVNVNTEGKFFIDDETKGISQSHGSGLLSLSSSLEFKLKCNNKEEVEYTDGKLSLTVTPNSFEVEKGQNLFSKAIEVIKELLEKLFGKERVTMKEYKFEFNEPKSVIDKPEVHNVHEQGKSAEK